jgi:hypothetical protein
VAVKAKKRLLGKHRTGLAILHAMGKRIRGAPTRADVVSASLTMLSRVLEVDGALEVALDLTALTAEALASSSGGTALATLRAGVRDLLLPDESARFGSRVRFKIGELVDGARSTRGRPGR